MPRTPRTRRSKRTLDAASIAFAAAAATTTTTSSASSSTTLVRALPSPTISSMGNTLTVTRTTAAGIVPNACPSFTSTIASSSSRHMRNPYPDRVTSRFFASSSSSSSKNEEEKELQVRVPIVKEEDESQMVIPKETVERTQSFGPLWHGLYEENDPVKIHTLFLGTHPSIASLGKRQYFGHNMNAFWWIAGDCLGFRRDTAISPSSGKQYQLASELKYDVDRIIPYEDQLKTFTQHGFALWDVLESCERKGSLDTAIKKETPNKIREFCQEHPTIKRIVMANGSTQCTFFNRHFKDWWESGELKPAKNEVSQKAFGKYAKKTNDFEHASIECLVGLGVSPAAAKFSYKEKRDYYEQYCYAPGLLDHKELNS